MVKALLLGALLLVQQGPEISVGIRPRLVRVGSEAILTIRVRSEGSFPEALEFSPPAGLEVVDVQERTSVGVGGRGGQRVLERDVYLRALEPGEYALPPVTVTVNGQTRQAPSPGLTAVASPLQWPGAGEGRGRSRAEEGERRSSPPVVSQGTPPATGEMGEAGTGGQQPYGAWGYPGYPGYGAGYPGYGWGYPGYGTAYPGHPGSGAGYPGFPYPPGFAWPWMPWGPNGGWPIPPPGAAPWTQSYSGGGWPQTGQDSVPGGQGWPQPGQGWPGAGTPWPYPPPGYPGGGYPGGSLPGGTWPGGAPPDSTPAYGTAPGGGSPGPPTLPAIPGGRWPEGMGGGWAETAASSPWWPEVVPQLHRYATVAEDPSGQASLAAGLTPVRVFTGQQVTLVATASFPPGAFLGLGGDPEYVPPSPPEFWAVDLPRTPRAMPTASGGGVDQGYTFRRAFFPLEPGEKVIPPPLLLLPRRSGALGGAAWDTVATDPLAVSVAPLPPAPDLPGYGGAVGRYRLEAGVTPESLAVGETALLVVRVLGAGNVRTLPPPTLGPVYGAEVSPGPDHAAVEVRDGVVGGVRAFTWLLVPTEPGPLRVGPVLFSYFDPYLGDFAQTASEELILQVTEFPSS
mgnify:FL=1